MKTLSPKTFQKTILDFYHKNKREFPWRETFDPYKIVVSEIMLQQTQAGRVVEKFNSFLKKFPNFKSLARASVPEVLKEWQGLGYNRRGLNLKRLAEEVMEKYKGKIPESPEELEKLPGIGKATAGSVYAFAFDRRSVFIETNIRRVFIHFFFPKAQKVSDEKLFPLIEKTLPKRNFREWYFALMDYGAYLKRIVANPNRRSKHYVKQSKFEGSNRQIRGEILKFVTKHGGIEKKDFKKLPFDMKKIEANIVALKKEGFF